MSKGYLLFALDNFNVNYSKLTHACALSIKLTQPKEFNSVSVVTNNQGYFLENKIFDHVIPSGLLSGMDARAWAYDLSPYDETVLLDSDMLILRPIDHYWNICARQDLFITTTPQNYKRQTFKYGAYRKIFEKYGWPDVYNAYTYFKKSDLAKEFFDYVKFITANQKNFINKILPADNLDSIPTDEAFALSLVILGLEDYATNNILDFPRITHMKPWVQGWDDFYLNRWQDKINFSIDEKFCVRIGSCLQTDILHYVGKDLITDSVIKNLEAML